MRRRRAKGVAGSGRLRVSRLGALPAFFLSKLAVKNLTLPREMPGLTAVHVKLPPRYAHAPIVHRRTAEWFLVLKGRGRGVIGSAVVQFRPGTIVFIPAGMAHQMSTGAGALEILAIFTPPLDARRKDADIHAAAEPPRPRPHRRACFGGARA